MTISNVELRDWSRDNRDKGAVIRADWSATPFEHRQAVRVGLEDKQVILGDPARWTLAGPLDPEAPDPPNDDELFVWNSVGMGQALNLYIQAVVTDNAASMTVSPEWNPELVALDNKSAYRSEVLVHYETQVQNELDWRENNP